MVEDRLARSSGACSGAVLMLAWIIFCYSSSFLYWSMRSALSFSTSALMASRSSRSSFMNFCSTSSRTSFQTSSRISCYQMALSFGPSSSSTSSPPSAPTISIWWDLSAERGSAYPPNTMEGEGDEGIEAGSTFGATSGTTKGGDGDLKLDYSLILASLLIT